MAYKRELIINNGSLTSYKKILKVSDVCQLLDKRTFETRTYGGTTATYNNDGTFTVSGTATANSWKNFPVFQLLPGGGEHVYLFNVVGSSEDTNCCCNIYFYDEITDRSVELMDTGREGSAVIKKLETPTVYQARFNITTLTGATPNNIVYKPQLFDLTEMYGAGNEPATVEEFKAKFPNELYDYSPRCWVTSYKTGLIAKTKNLFDYKTPEYADATLIETLSNGAILKGNLCDDAGTGAYANGWFRPGDAENKRIELKTGDVVTISADYMLLEQYSLESNICNIHLYCDIDSLRLTTGASSIVKLPLNETVRISQTYTIKGDADYYPIFTLNSNKVKITNIQIEKGTTATDYVPYGYL